MNLVCAGNNVFVTYQAEGGFNPNTPPLAYAPGRVADVWRLQTGRMRFSIFLVYSKSWTHTNINNISYKTHRGSALTSYYYQRSAMTVIVAILD